MSADDILRAIEEFERISPTEILQAIAILDCPATEEHAIKLNYGVDLIAIVQHFGASASKVVRWFYSNASREKRVGELFSTFTFDMEPRVVTKRGFALVLSRKMFKELTAASVYLQGDASTVFGPKIYDLNEDQHDG